MVICTWVIPIYGHMPMCYTAEAVTPVASELAATGPERVYVRVRVGIIFERRSFMTSRRYRQTNSAQKALKETNRFTQLNADPCSYARVSRRDDYVSFDTTIFENNCSIGSWRERQNSHLG